MRKEIENEIVNLRRAYEHVNDMLKSDIALGITPEMSYPQTFKKFLQLLEELIKEEKQGRNWACCNYVPADLYGRKSPRWGALQILSYLSQSEKKRLGLDNLCY